MLVSLTGDSSLHTSILKSVGSKMQPLVLFHPLAEDSSSLTPKMKLFQENVDVLLLLKES